MAANLKKLKQGRRSAEQQGRVTKDSPLARARRKAKDSKKTGVRQTRKQKDVSVGAGGKRSVNKSPRQQRRTGKLVGPAKKSAALRVTGGARSGQTERVANQRSKSHSAGIRMGGQTGKKPRGLNSPSRGRRGRAPALD